MGLWLEKPSGWGRKNVTEGQSMKSEPDKTLQVGGESQKNNTNHTQITQNLQRIIYSKNFIINDQKPTKPKPKNAL